MISLSVCPTSSTPACSPAACRTTPCASCATRPGELAGRARGRHLAVGAGVLGGHALRRRPARAAHARGLLLVARRHPDPRPRPGRPAVHPPDDPQHGPAGAGAPAHAGDGRVHPAAAHAVRRRHPGTRAARAAAGRAGSRFDLPRDVTDELPLANLCDLLGVPDRRPRPAAGVDEPGDRLPGPRARRGRHRAGREAGEPALARAARRHVRLRGGAGRAQAPRAGRRRHDGAGAGRGRRRAAHRRRAEDVLLPAGDRGQRHRPQRAARRGAPAAAASGRSTRGSAPTRRCCRRRSRRCCGCTRPC